MVEQQPGLSPVVRVNEQQERERIAADERKKHAARTTEILKDRYGVEDGE